MEVTGMRTLNSRSSDRASEDCDVPLVWPPVESAKAFAAVIDLRKNVTVPLGEASHAFVDQSIALSGPQSSVSNPTAASLPSPGGRVDNAGRLRRVSSSTLVSGLALMVVAESITVVLFLARGGSVDGHRDPGAAAAAIPHASGDAQSRTFEPAQLESVVTTPARDVAALTSDSGSHDGRLLVRSEPAGATVVVDGRRQGTAPLTLDGLADGTHRVQIQRGGQSVEQMVTIEAATTTSLLVPLSATGWLDLRASVDVQIFEDGRLLGTSDGPLVLAPGRHHLELRNELLGYRDEVEGTVVAGQIARLRPALPDGVLQISATPWALVLVDGEEVGETPLGDLHVPLGSHEVRFRHPTLGEQARQIVVSALAPARISVDLQR
jgi:hypothetical protein